VTDVPSKWAYFASQAPRVISKQGSAKDKGEM